MTAASRRPSRTISRLRGLLRAVGSWPRGGLWLEIVLARSRFIPAMSFVEQPPTIVDTQDVQRFQANLSAFSATWNYLALMALLFWFLFYAL